MLVRRPMFVLLVLLAVAPGRTAHGAEPYDLAACIRAALAQSPDLAAVAADLAVARSRLDMARAGRFGEIEYRHVVGIVNEARGDATFSPDDRRDVFDGLGPYTPVGGQFRADILPLLRRIFGRM